MTNPDFPLSKNSSRPHEQLNKLPMYMPSSWASYLVFLFTSKKYFFNRQWVVISHVRVSDINIFHWEIMVVLWFACSPQVR